MWAAHPMGRFFQRATGWPAHRGEGPGERGGHRPLHRGTRQMARKHRHETGSGNRRRRSSGTQGDLLYGWQPVLESLRAGRRQHRRLLISSSKKSSNELDELRNTAASLGVPVEEAQAEVFERQLADANHQGVALETSPYVYASVDDVLGKRIPLLEPLIVILDHVQDPQNVGSLLRSSDGAGVQGVIIPKDRACRVTPAVVRASAGAAEHMLVAEVTNLVRTMKLLKDREFWLAGLEACERARLCRETDLSGPIGLVVGSEGRGVGRLVRETCDFLVKLPMHGKVNSLNVGVATAIALYEVRRQQEGREGGRSTPNVQRPTSNAQGGITLP